MNYSFQIKTLTPLHIGSGREWQSNMEYLCFREARRIALADDEKIFKVIGKENLHQWTSIIEQRKDLLGYLLERKQGLKPEDVSSQVIEIAGTAPAVKHNIREYARNGTGKPLLAGSSVKGSIRTALLTKLLYDKYGDGRIPSPTVRDNRGKISDTFLMKEIFGNNPNNDFMRFFRISDGYFEKTKCYSVVTLNRQEDEWAVYGILTNFIEAVPAGSLATCSVNIPEDLIREAKKRNYNYPADDLMPEKLFPIINSNTGFILDKELKFFKKEPSSNMTEAYVEQLEKLTELTAGADDHSCIMRMSFGSGWKFMTGYWQAGYLEERDFNDVRRNVHRKNYPASTPLPKSRKLLEDGKPLGFVKLTYQHA